MKIYVGSLLLSLFLSFLVFIVVIVLFRNVLPNFVCLILNSNPKTLDDVKDVVDISYNTWKYDRRK